MYEYRLTENSKIISTKVMSVCNHNQLPVRGTHYPCCNRYNRTYAKYAKFQVE